MKTYRYILVLMTIVMSVSCSQEDMLCESDVVQTQIEQSNDEERYARLRAQLRSQYVGELKRTYGVGYGYNATGKYANYDDVRDRIVELSELYRYDSINNLNTIIDDNAPSAFQHILEGKDSETLLKSMSANAGLSADIGLFQAEVKMSYSSSDMKSDSYSFCTIQDGVTLVSRHLEPYDLIAIAKKNPNVLTAGFRRYIDLAAQQIKGNRLAQASKTLQDMFETYGTHFIYHAELGGLLNFTSTIERRSLDSKTSLSVSAKASFMDMCGMGVAQTDESSFTQTSTQKKCRITARGGDVTLVTRMLSLNDEDDQAKKKDLCNKWYQSVCYDFNDDSKCNVELIGMKLIPVSDFIYDDAVKMYYDLLCGNEIEQADNTFPRVYNKCYARIPVEELDLVSDDEQLIVKDNNEIIGEIDNECINHCRYVVFYPTLDGEVQHEGIGRNLQNDSLYLITWDIKNKPEDSEVQITGVGRLRALPYLYYNHGDVDFSPTEGVKYDIDISVERFGVTMWTETNYSNFRCGPYTLATGCYATNIGLSNYDVVSLDVPQGYSAITIEEIEAMETFLAQHLVEGPCFFGSQKNWLMPDGESVRFSYENDTLTHVTETGKEWGYVLCKRNTSFRYP